jgi:exosortase
VTNRARSVALFVLVAASIALWWHPLVATCKLALSNEAYTHILLILPFSLALIYLEARQLPAILQCTNRAGAVLMSAAVLLRTIAAWNLGNFTPGDCLSLSMAALVICWLGSVILCFGFRTFQLLSFPLCFLVLLVPFPEQLLKVITEFLQCGSAKGASLLFRLAQVPVMRDGINLSIPGLDIEVARECSSIRSSMVLIVITLILAHLFLGSRWRKVLLVLAAIPLSLAKNAVRIFIIGELTTRVDPRFLTGRLHRQGGIVFLGFAVIVVIVLLWILKKSELRRSQVPSFSRSPA